LRCVSPPRCATTEEAVAECTELLAGKSCACFASCDE